MIQKASIELTRDQAEAYMKAIDLARKAAVVSITAIDRSRRYTAAQKDRLSAPHHASLAAYIALQECIGTAFSIGGY